MRIVQADPGVDGWWGLVEGDDEATVLVKVPDARGRKAKRPTDAEFFARVRPPTPATSVEVVAEDGTVV